ncbi:hypothetical protein AB1Y20_019829 [Prymnesium parvum]|uniref:Uncharacterized protein n=1 Tax=Prymnesium parvum TaxID=97485 RepID=A0AB34JV82_PRYPA
MAEELKEELLPTASREARRCWPCEASAWRIAAGSGLHVVPRLRLADFQHSATTKERFFDLMFMLVIGNLTKLPLTAAGLAQMCFYFSLLWNLWVGVAFFNTRFDTDDVIARCFAFLDMLGVIGMAAGVQLPIWSPSGFCRVVGFYALVRLGLVLKYVRVWLALPSTRQLSSGFIRGFSLGVLSWAAAIAIAPTPTALVWTFAAFGLAFDYGTPFALLRGMVAVHKIHMPQRFSGFVALMFIGVLFNFMQTLPTPTSAETMTRYLLHASVMVNFAFFYVLLYSKLTGPLVEHEFAASTMNKLRTYLYLYLHMPLKLTITLASAAVRHTLCELPTAANAECVDGVGRLLCLLCGAILLQLGALHLLEAERNTRRCAIRVACAVKLLVVAVFPLDGITALVIILAALGGQVIFDYFQWSAPPTTAGPIV